MIDFLRRLVATPSLSAEEGDAVALCAEEMRRLGYDVKLDASGSALGVLGSGHRRLLFDGHADTVAAGPGWTRDPHGAELEGGRLYGLAATDMKGSLAALIHGVADAARAGELSATIGVSITTLEEVIEGATLASVVDHFQPDAVVVAEPSGCRLTLAQRGRAEIIVEVEGRAAHAAFPERGANALIAGALILVALEEREAPSDPELGQGILVPTEATTEPFPGVSIVPSRCSIRLDRRTLPGECEEAVLAELEPFLAVAARAGARARARISGGDVTTYAGAVLPARRFLPAWRADPDEPFVRTAAAALPVGRPALFCTNGSLTAGRGIPTVIFGPGDPGLAHQADEYVELKELALGRQGFAALASLSFG